MKKKLQVELLSDCVDNLSENELRDLMKHLIENADKKHRDILEQNIMDNNWDIHNRIYQSLIED